MSAAAAEGRDNPQVTARMTSTGREAAPNRSAATFELAPRRGKLEAAFAADSYRPGERAALGIWGNARRVAVQVFRTGPERVRTRGNERCRASRSPRSRCDSDGRQLTVRVENWPTGMYFARVRAGGQVAFAPFVVRPRRLGKHRVAVVMPTNTWQAYNFRDDDGDGAADTWYADRRRHTVRVARPHLNHGVPMRFRAYDLPFLHWLAWSKREVDYLAQTDIERTSGRALRQRYELIIFPGHHEYVTGREYNAVTSFRDLGGNLMFLSANNFFWKVERRGNTLHQIAMWRDLRRPEATLVGVQYVTYGSELAGRTRSGTPTPRPGSFAAPACATGRGSARNGVAEEIVIESQRLLRQQRRRDPHRLANAVTRSWSATGSGTTAGSGRRRRLGTATRSATARRRSWTAGRPGRTTATGARWCGSAADRAGRRERRHGSSPSRRSARARSPDGGGLSSHGVPLRADGRTAGPGRYHDRRRGRLSDHPGQPDLGQPRSERPGPRPVDHRPGQLRGLPGRGQRPRRQCGPSPCGWTRRRSVGGGNATTATTRPDRRAAGLAGPDTAAAGGPSRCRTGRAGPTGGSVGTGQDVRAGRGRSRRPGRYRTDPRERQNHMNHSGGPGKCSHHCSRRIS